MTKDDKKVEDLIAQRQWQWGGLIYITRPGDPKQEPLNFHRTGKKTATSGNWPFGLTDPKRPFTWLLIYYKYEIAEGGRVWIADRGKPAHKKKKPYVFNLSNVRGHFEVSKPLEDFVDVLRNPEHPQYIPPKLGDSTQIDDFNDIDETSDSPTEALELKKIRIGQGKFGLAVGTIWKSQCAVTGSSTRAVLEAAHILPWADSAAKERIDPNNGLLLTANLHRLLDAGLISFKGKTMLVSSKLSLSERDILGLNSKELSKEPSAKTAKYLSDHRKKWGFE
jgi:hypothetical protein